MSRRPLSRDELHQIGIRRRKDLEVTAVLWEVCRLREILGTIGAHVGQLRSEEPVHREYFLSRLQDLLEAERLRFDPKASKQRQLSGRKPEREPTNGYAQRRLEQLAEDEPSEREAKRQARHRRG